MVLFWTYLEKDKTKKQQQKAVKQTGNVLLFDVSSF
jgi:hypothetical protein